jgi:hypothetical protein
MQDRRAFKAVKGRKDSPVRKVFKAFKGFRDPPGGQDLRVRCQDPPDRQEVEEEEAAERDRPDLRGKVRTASLTGEIQPVHTVRIRRLISAELYKRPCPSACNFAAGQRPNGCPPIPLSRKESLDWRRTHSSSRSAMEVALGLPSPTEGWKDLRALQGCRDRRVCRECKELQEVWGPPVLRAFRESRECRAFRDPKALQDTAVRPELRLS